MLQNLMSVAASDDICKRAAAAAASSALRLPAALAAPSIETAFMRPAATVDFSAWVADMVRR